MLPTPLPDRAHGLVDVFSREPYLVAEPVCGERPVGDHPSDRDWDTDGNAHLEVVQWLNGGGARKAVDRAIARGSDDHDLLRSLAESRAALAPSSEEPERFDEVLAECL